MKIQKLFIALFFVILSTQIQAQVTSLASGPWSSASTWSSGVVPDSNTNVLVGAHNITIDDGSAVCKNVAFSDTGHFIMSADISVLKVYGDFTLRDSLHRVFTTWTTGAKIVFTGSALVQNLVGWKITAWPTGTGASTSFQEMIVDKDTGKVSTAGNNMRFCFGSSLEIKKGIFELDTTDDIQSSSIGGTGLKGTITVQSLGAFYMVGGGSHIRSGTFLQSTDSLAAKIGKMTVYGKATLTSISSNGINLNGIEIMNGGLVILNPGFSINGYFNPGIITVHSGGVLQSSTTTALYHKTAYIAIEAGGEFNCGTSTTPLPLLGINYSQGTVRFSRSDTSRIPASMTTFNNLYLSGGGPKLINSDIVVNGTLSLRGTASLGLNGYSLTYGPSAILQYGAPGQTTAQLTAEAEFPSLDGPKNLSIYNNGGVTLHASRTITGNLTLSSGNFDNNGLLDDLALTMASGSTIRRAVGTLSVAPVFSSQVNVAYISTVSSVTTGLEIPASPATLQNLSIVSTQGVDLASDITVNGTLSFETGAAGINTGVHTLTLGSNALLAGETPTAYVKGVVSTQRAIGVNANNFGGIGFNLSSGSDNIATASISRFSGDAGIVTINGKDGIARNWNVNASSQPVNGRTITLTWPSGDDNGKLFSSTVPAKVMQFTNTDWAQVGAGAEVQDSDPRSISVFSNILSSYTIFDTAKVTAVKDNNPLGAKDFAIHQNYPNPFNPSTSIRFEIGSAQFVNLQIVNILGNTVATVVNRNLQAGSHTAQFDASALPSGVYFAVIKANSSSKLIKMLLIK